jgi:tRNA(Arg) A34 adenosine deaminase TadA
VNDEFFMRLAIDAAHEAEKLDEVPIGACLIDKNGEVLAVCGNRTIIIKLIFHNL